MSRAVRPDLPQRTAVTPESFIRETTNDRRTFERLLANVIPQWDESQPTGLPKQEDRPRWWLLGLGAVVGLGAVATCGTLLWRAPPRSRALFGRRSRLRRG